jgi:hypothetical protein
MSSYRQIKAYLSQKINQGLRIFHIDSKKKQFILISFYFNIRVNSCEFEKS